MKPTTDENPPLGFLVVRVAEAIDRSFVDALAELGLKPRELRLLVLVDRSPGLSQRELADALDVDAGNLIASLDALDQRGVLKRVRDTTDRRQRRVTLTDEGQRLLAAAIRATAAFETKIFKRLSSTQLRSYYKMTRAVYEGL
jgi:DNA-binding MarR family transcriptional regulator